MLEVERRVERPAHDQFRRNSIDASSEPIHRHERDHSREGFGAYPPTRFQRGAMAIGRHLPRNYLGRRLSAMLRSLVHHLADKPVDIEVMGFRMRIHLDNNACERRLLLTPHFFDPVELEILKPRVKPGFHFIDLGANVGAYSLFVAGLAGGDARVLAIEPQPEIVERLETNISLNGFDIDVAAVAILEEPGEAKLVVSHGNRGSVSVSRDSHGRQAGQRLIRVPAMTLLDLVQSRGFSRIDALKADIEGSEDRALVPFFSSAPKSLWPRLMIVEHSPEDWQTDLIAVLHGIGYRQIGPVRANVVLELANG